MGLRFREYLEMFYNEPKNKFSLKTNSSQARYAHVINPANIAKQPSSINPQSGINNYNPRNAGSASIPRSNQVYYPKKPSIGFKPAI